MLSSIPRQIPLLHSQLDRHEVLDVHNKSKLFIRNSKISRKRLKMSKTKIKKSYRIFINNMTSKKNLNTSSILVIHLLSYTFNNLRLDQSKNQLINQKDYRITAKIKTGTPEYRIEEIATLKKMLRLRFLRCCKILGKTKGNSLIW